ncbi:DUF4236 domain-containing protein [Alteribacillus bidgolensis]|uniref:DUF4236 domain-containing protein n=1 Tax=Alteribacillus bidgolensis TaxID=930129 RepID=A0A1G8RDA6_9BACI|nr:DUF4236 domain-containing protein [Alteribacillus bidgolensis]SDJ14899.1 Protein of unknown function [Alteribacillus bidgolensis]
MAFRFRKSVKVAPGVKLNVGKRGVSTTVGGKSVRVSSSSRRTSVGSSVPGTGVSYHKQVGSKNVRSKSNKNKHQGMTGQEEEHQQNQPEQQVKQYEDHLVMLTSLHEEVTDGIDWKEVSLSAAPFTPPEDGTHVKKLNKQIENFKPTFRDRFFNRSQSRIEKMKSQLPEAKEKDLELYKKWENDVDQAYKVLAGDREAWTKVIKTQNPFEDIAELGGSIKFSFEENRNIVIVNLHIDKSAVPAKEISLTKTGKLSQKNMPKGKHFQLYQEYVCSCALRIGREFFSLLPLDSVLLHVYGEAEETNGCILSVLIKKSDLEQLSFTQIDFLEVIKTFEHNLKFLKTKGFKTVEEVKEF